MSTTPLENSSLVSTTLAKQTLQVSTKPALSVTPLSSDMAVLMSVTESIRYWTYLVLNLLISNLSNSEPQFWTYWIPNLSDSEPIWFQTYQIPNLSDSESIRFQTCEIWTQVMNLSGTEPMRYWAVSPIPCKSWDDCQHPPLLGCPWQNWWQNWSTSLPSPSPIAPPQLPLPSQPAMTANYQHDLWRN